MAGLSLQAGCLLLTSPMTQLNTPYPATGVLVGHLRAHGVAAAQADLSIELFHRLFSGDSVRRMHAGLDRASEAPAVAWWLEAGPEIAQVVDAVVRFLRGADPMLAHRLVGGGYLPVGPRLARALGEPEALAELFGPLGLQDRAKHLASLFIDDLADAIRDGVDPAFALSRYGASLAGSQPSFDPLAAALDRPATWVAQCIEACALEGLRRAPYDHVGFSVPFAGNLLGALVAARALRRAHPDLRIALGGGYVNTELRALAEARLFDHVDVVCLDDGEAPLRAWVSGAPLVRSFVRGPSGVTFVDHPVPPVAHDRDDDPTTDGLSLDRYVSLLELPNPMHRLWSDGRWNKLTLAHGCYWRKCSFCDTSLDYIARYEPAKVDTLLRRIRKLVAETGQSGFHFTDEAAPPALLRALARRLIEEGPEITWWTNIRFDRAFDLETTEVLARSGCVAVSGGLEVASDRLLQAMEKGVSIDQVARVTNAFAEQGILVHAYLMYGFPTETLADSVDALEVVRQLFVAGCIHSGFWHRFAATVHSPVGREPARFGVVVPVGQDGPFSNNDRTFVDPTPCDHDAVGEVLDRALYNYMHGVGLDWPVAKWFGKGAPRPRVHDERILRAIGAEPAER